MGCMQVCTFFYRVEDLCAHLWTCIQCLVRNDLTVTLGSTRCPRVAV